MKRKDDFQKFYFQNVATGEGCGCAERVIDVHEFNRLAGRPRRLNPPLRKSLSRLLKTLGLYRRPGE